MMDNTISLLTHTPRALDALLRGLPESWTHRDEGDGSWTVFDVVGHLIHGEQTNWIPRTKIILEHGESRPFDKFDRTAMMRESEGKTLPQLLDAFAAARNESLRELRELNLQPADLDRKGTHPALGVVTLGNLLATWADHDLTHLHQISRIMAHQVRGDVGPWTKF